ncbi:hypothetical protein EXE00_19205 [Acinetobacter pittii]|nr:hypothetical protein EXE00_19205 [Acinetobacter pittii]
MRSMTLNLIALVVYLTSCVGRVGQGILYLIFCWTFIPAIIAFIEGILYLCSSDEDFAKKYG